MSMRRIPVPSEIGIVRLDGSGNIEITGFDRQLQVSGSP